MSAAGIRKAALLLMDLAPATAAELLKFAQPDTITRIVAELTYLQEAGIRSDSTPVREFCTLVSKKDVRPDAGGLARQILESTLGAEKARTVMAQVQALSEWYADYRAGAPEVRGTGAHA